MLKIKKSLGILLAVCFLMSVTATAVSAITDAGAGGSGGDLLCYPAYEYIQDVVVGSASNPLNIL